MVVDYALGRTACTSRNPKMSLVLRPVTLNILEYPEIGQGSEIISLIFMFRDSLNMYLLGILFGNNSFTNYSCSAGILSKW